MTRLDPLTRAASALNRQSNIDAALLKGDMLSQSNEVHSRSIPWRRFAVKPSPIALLALLLVLALSSSAQNHTFKVIHAFGGPGDGSGPFGPLVLDSQGNLYGGTGGARASTVTAWCLS